VFFLGEDFPVLARHDEGQFEHAQEIRQHHIVQYENVGLSPIVGMVLRIDFYSVKPDHDVMGVDLHPLAGTNLARRVADNGNRNVRVGDARPDSVGAAPEMSR
jgi:hypothetical protein